MMKWQVSRRMAGIILALGAALALAACSAVKLGYSSLPNLVGWWLDGYVDLTEEQEPRVRDQIAALHTWHRQHELPRVVELLGRMEGLVAGEISSQQACGLLQEVQLRLKAVAAQAEAPAVALASTLSARQLRQVARKFRSNNERFHKEWVALSREEQQDKRYKQMLERLESVYGRLDEPQRAVLRQRLAATSWDASRLLAQRQRRQQELLQVLARLSQPGIAPAEGAALLRAWVERLERPADPSYRAYQEALLQEGCATFAAVHRSTTADQRLQAVRRLQSWQRDLRELIVQQP